MTSEQQSADEECLTGHWVELTLSTAQIVTQKSVLTGKTQSKDYKGMKKNHNIIF